jgi:acyl-CoA thioesterase YciA
VILLTEVKRDEVCDYERTARPGPGLAIGSCVGHDGPMTKPTDLQPAIRVLMMPRDTNSMGTIFGGIILSYIDQAGAVEAHLQSEKKLVTVAMHEVKFIAPVFVGDLVSFYTETIRVGNTSLTVRVTVEAIRYQAPHETVRVTQAEVVYVAIDDAGQPIPVRS